jgi:multidrug transporter EmrE-like cation transporter
VVNNLNGFETSGSREKKLTATHLYLLIFSIFIQAFGAICTKYAAINTGTTLFFGIRTEFIIYFIILGGMGLQVIFWQKALQYYSLSFAYPFRSLVSFIVLIFAYVLFQESVTPLNVIGLIIISLGIFYLVKDKEYLR